MQSLAGQTILVVEDEPLITLELEHALAEAGARVLLGAHHTHEPSLSAAVLDSSRATVTQHLAERQLPFIFYSGRPASEFKAWPNAPVVGKPSKAEAIIEALVRLLDADLGPQDLLITDALRDRPGKVRDGPAQLRAFHQLSKLAMSDPTAAVQRFLESAVELCNAGSAGWSRLGRNDAEEVVFVWDALAGSFAPYVGGTTPRDFSPCGLCLNAGRTVLVAKPARVFTYFNKVDVPITEALIVPVYDAAGAALGTIWVVQHDDKSFDAEDARVMEQLAVLLVLALKLMGDGKQSHLEQASHLALMQDNDHRVKNTIQSITSLLLLQARACKAPEARVALQEASRRLDVFMRVHELLQNNGAGDRAVDIAEVIEKLAEALASTFSGRATLRVQADHVLVESRHAIPLTLLINEAVTNAFKHAYPAGQPGEVFVRVAKTARGGLRIGIQDDGVGLPPNVHEGALGLTLMRAFASQLGGGLTISSDKGTAVHLTVLDGAASTSNGELALRRQSADEANGRNG